VKKRNKNKFKDCKSMSTDHVLLTDETLTRVETTTTIKQYDRVVNFYDLEEAVQVEPDDFPAVPWKDCDGYEHELIAIPEGVDASDAEGYLGSGGRDGFHGVDYREAPGGGEYVVKSNPKSWGNYEGMRARGASKQTAQMYEAHTVAKTNAMLARWMRDGWEVYYVKLEWEQYEDSVGGVLTDNSDYSYLEEVKREIALQVAYLMEKDGFIIEDKPPAESEPKLTAREWTTIVSQDGVRKDYVPHGRTASEWKKEWKRRLHEQDARFDDDYHRMRRSMRRHAHRHRFDK
jgi:hypothetical protein